jgi:hypothetical protein
MLLFLLCVVLYVSAYNDNIIIMTIKNDPPIKKKIMVLLNVYIIFESVAVDIFTLLDELPYDLKRLYFQS